MNILNRLQEISIRLLIYFGLMMWPTLLIICIVHEVNADDNIIHIEQTGDNFNLDIEQIGYSNIVEMYNSYYVDSNNNVWYMTGMINGSSNTVNIEQNRVAGIKENVVSIGAVEGYGNALHIKQGYAQNGNTWANAHGGNFMGIAIGGDNNTVHHTQSAGKISDLTEGHESYIHIGSNDNYVVVDQHEGGSQFLEVNILSDDNTVEVTQKGTGSHTAAIQLDGLYGTDISLTQDSQVNQGYTIQQYCMTVDGCAVTVVQN